MSRPLHNNQAKLFFPLSIDQTTNIKISPQSSNRSWILKRINY